MMERLEILAPVGNWDSLKAAINNGADAVYLGLDKFNARSKAENFTEENIKEVIDYCHLFDCKVYLTVNTLLKDKELVNALEMIKFANQQGIDAFIVQDLGLITQVMSTMSNIILHASTQMGIHNLEGVKIAEALGIKRVVLARETLLEDIKKIKQNSAMELEFFVQGALCVAFSGNCYFSSLVSGYSGNRGKCLQLCRKKYYLNNAEESSYFLSTKDICLTSRMKELISCGITSFKIEGRMRRPEYVGESVRIYKKALTQNISIDDLNNLKQLFNRGDYCEAHLDGTMPTIHSLIPNHSGVKIGKVKSVENNQAFIETKFHLKKGDGVKFLRNGIEMGSALISNDNINKTGFSGHVTFGDDICITTNTTLNESINKRNRYLDVSISAAFKKNMLPEIEACYNNVSISLLGDNITQGAKNSPTPNSDIIDNLSKSGGTNFNISKVNLTCDENIFLPKSEVNLLRRKALELLKSEILVQYNAHRVIVDSTMPDTPLLESLKSLDFKPKSIFVVVSELKQITQYLLNNVDFLILNPSEYSVKIVEEFYKLASVKSILNLPITSRGKDVDLIKLILDTTSIQNCLINNIGGIEIAKEKNILLGWGMNMLNAEINFPKVASLESESIMDNNNTVIYAHGFAPLMNITHCPRNKKCVSCNGENLHIKDEKGFTFTLKRQKQYYCYHQMFNDIPTDIMSEINKLKFSSIMLDLSCYDTTTSEEIVRHYKKNIPLQIQKTKGNINKELK